MRVQIRTRPAPESVFEGQELTLVCSVDGARGPVRVSWYRKPRWAVMSKQFPREAELRIRAVQNRDAGQYHCEASVGHSSYRSKPVTINVRGASAGPQLGEDTGQGPGGECGCARKTGQGQSPEVNASEGRDGAQGWTRLNHDGQVRGPVPHGLTAE